MKEHPLLLSAPMVLAMLAGRKRVTRRILSKHNTLIDGKPWGKSKCKPKDLDWASATADGGKVEIACDHHCYHTLTSIYLPDDVAWFKETYFAWRCKIYDSQGMHEQPETVVYRADGGTLLNGAKWKPSIFMPRHLSRLVRPIIGSRIERLQDITEADARLEGFGPRSARALFKGVWDELRPHPGQRWIDNPLIIRIEMASPSMPAHESTR